MGKLIHFKKKKRRGNITGTGYRSTRRSVKSPVDIRMKRSRKKSGILALARRYYKIIAIAGVAVAAVVVCLVLFLGGNNTPVSGETASPQTMPPSPEESYDYSNVDDDVLAGLAGTDESLFTDDEELADAIFAQEGIRIGVTVGNIDSSDEELVLNRLEQVSSVAETEKSVYKVYYYNANGNYNQQLQDVRSLIKNEVDVIIVGFTEAESFNMVTMMAQNEGIPVVAFDAPVQEGYAINVVADQSAWASVYGKFMASKLTAGNLVQILGSQESPVDTARAKAINTQLATNANIVTTGTAYAGWNKAAAKTAMADYISNGTVDGVITEEGMAEGVLDAFIEARKLPKVMCGDATAGFIKKWYALKNSGIDITPEPEDDKKNDDKTTPAPTPTPIMFTAQPGELIVCAQPAPSGIGAAAFEIALEMAKGRTLKEEGQTFNYVVETLITDENLAAYYEQVKDMADSYIISDLVSDAVLDSLLNPMPEETQTTVEPIVSPTPTKTTVAE